MNIPDLNNKKVIAIIDKQKLFLNTFPTREVFQI